MKRQKEKVLAYQKAVILKKKQELIEKEARYRKIELSLKCQDEIARSEINCQKDASHVMETLYNLYQSLKGGEVNTLVRTAKKGFIDLVNNFPVDDDGNEEDEETRVLNERIREVMGECVGEYADAEGNLIGTEGFDEEGNFIGMGEMGMEQTGAGMGALGVGGMGMADIGTTGAMGISGTTGGIPMGIAGEFVSGIGGIAVEADGNMENFRQGMEQMEGMGSVTGSENVSNSLKMMGKLSTKKEAQLAMLGNKKAENASSKAGNPATQGDSSQQASQGGYPDTQAPSPDLLLDDGKKLRSVEEICSMPLGGNPHLEQVFWNSI
jgi:hypothetical protein